MTKLKRFPALLFVAAYIGTLGIPGTPRDYMWAAEIPPSLTGGDAAGTASSLLDSFPTLHLPADIVVPSDPDQDSAMVVFEVTASDDQAGVSLVTLPRSGSTFPIGITTVFATAVDTAGHLVQGSFTVTVTDSRPPTIRCPADLVLAPDVGSMARVVDFDVTATDNCPGVRVSTMPPSGSIFPMGDTLVLCTATDAAGNTAACAFTVTIADREAPAIICPTNLIVVAEPGECGARVHYEVSSQELNPNSFLLSLPSPGSFFPIGVNTVYCLASDAAGNIATKTFAITVIDAEPPSLTVPEDLAFDLAPGETNIVVNYEVTATDNCSDAELVSWPPSGSNFPVGTITAIALATDASGNRTLGTFKVTVRSQEIEPPVITRILPSRRVLWSAKNRMIPVGLRVGAVGKSARVVSRRIIAVTCNEPDGILNGASPDWIISGPLRLWLRAECNSAVNDRIYTIIVECKDALGNVATGTTSVRVPHRRL